MTTLAPTTPVDLARLEDLWTRAEQLVQGSRAASTRASYQSDWKQIQGWCAAAGLPVEVPMPPQTLAMYLADQSRLLHSSTLSRRLAAVRWIHGQVGQPSPSDHPQVRGVLAGVRRERQDTTKQAKPLYLADVAAAVAGLGDGLRDTRDRALLLVGFWSALRRSELVALNVGDLEDRPEGVIVRVRKSKTDQQGAGRSVPLHHRKDPALDPVLALRAWQRVSAIGQGAVWRQVNRWGQMGAGRLTGRAVSQVVKEAAARLQLNPDEYSAHSLRSGFVSTCDARQVPASAVMLTTGHKTTAMLSVYTRPRSLFTSAAGFFFDD